MVFEIKPCKLIVITIKINNIQQLMKKTVQFSFLLTSILFILLLFSFWQKSFAIDNCNDGWKVDSNGSKTINCHNTCRVINNNCSTSIFVPTKENEEWQQFLSHAPQCVNIQTCNVSLSVSKSGSGSGTVTSNPAGINCGTTCSASFEMNSQVTLTASPNSGSVFGGWSGDCSGTNTTCTLTMNSNKSVTAIFNSSGGGPTPTSPPGEEEPPPSDNCCNYCPCSCTTRDVGTCTEPEHCWNSKIGQWEPCCNHYRINTVISKDCVFIGKGEVKCWTSYCVFLIYTKTTPGSCNYTCGDVQEGCVYE